MECDYIKEASHDKIEAFSINEDQIVMILLIAEKINDMSVKEKTFQVNDIAYTDECSRAHGYNYGASVPAGSYTM